MKENKNHNNAKLLTLGIAVILILIICGISVVIHALNKRGSQDASSMLQEDIMEYANISQEQGVTASDIEKKKGVAEESGEKAGQKDEETPEASKQPETSKDPAVSKQTEEPAVVVKEEKNPPKETIMEEEAGKQDSSGEGKTTEKWQKGVSDNLAAAEIDLPRQMSEMRGYWEAGNMEAVEDLAYLPRYRAASEKLSGTTKYYYYGDTDENKRPNGKGLAMYTDNQYYYGEWKNGVRSGSGMWVKFYVYDRNAKAEDSIYLQHLYTGTWANDLPNGEGAEHYDFIEENLESGRGYNRNFIGNFKNGLYHGEIYITNYYGGGNAKEWCGTAKNGVWQPLGEKDAEGKYPVIYELPHPDNYQWIEEKANKNNGVDGLISAAK